LPGDVDGDCDVDVVDIMLVAGRWNSALGDPRYDPCYDVDGDGEIDVVDIMPVAAHWGGTCAGKANFSQSRGIAVARSQGSGIANPTRQQAAWRVGFGGW
jgi:hypothetical protein